MCFLHIPTLPEIPSESGARPWSAIINGDPGTISVKCLAQGYINIFFPVIGPTVYSLMHIHTFTKMYIAIQSNY